MIYKIKQKCNELERTIALQEIRCIIWHGDISVKDMTCYDASIQTI